MSSAQRLEDGSMIRPRLTPKSLAQTTAVVTTDVESRYAAGEDPRHLGTVTTDSEKLVDTRASRASVRLPNYGLNCYAPPSVVTQSCCGSELSGRRLRRRSESTFQELALKSRDALVPAR
jgi:hypothetical protein